MNMLSGTLAPSFGDATINGHSITRDKTMACRNLGNSLLFFIQYLTVWHTYIGICMQQDVIWDDLSVRDHLMLFGRLRGLHRTKLREV